MNKKQQNALEEIHAETARRYARFEAMFSLEVKHVSSLEEALAASCKEEQADHRNSEDYNAAEYRESCRSVEKIASKWYVIEGYIYYLNEMTGREQGLGLLNYFDMISCMHNSPFYKVHFAPSGRLMVCEQADGTPQGFKRDMASRKAFAKHGWLMTTSSKIFHAFKKKNQANRRELENA